MMDAKTLREALGKIMPGYSWTIHRAGKGATSLTATGTKSSGSNRLSTLEVRWSLKGDQDWYDVRSSGYGLRAPWLGNTGDVTLARALRGLQDHYNRMASLYGGHASALQSARTGEA